MPADAIVVSGVSKSYPGRGVFEQLRSRGHPTQALRDVSFTVREGETVGLLGPNGAGKTTLLKIIATLLFPSSGRVLVHDLDLVREPLKARRLMGLVTCDDRSFYWRLTGRQNLSFFATLYRVPPRESCRRVELLLETVGLAEAADRPFHSYSSGMKQKLAIARGLLSDPLVVLYDEPTRSLDPLGAQGIRNWIAANRAASPRTAHLIATNQLKEAERLCDRVVIINRGVLIAHGTINEIRNRFRNEQHVIHRVVCRAFRLNGVARRDPQEGLLEIVEESKDEDRATLRISTLEGSAGLSVALDAILRAGGRVIQCHTQEVAFDDVFCAIVEQQHADPAPAAGGAR